MVAVVAALTEVAGVDRPAPTGLLVPLVGGAALLALAPFVMLLGITLLGVVQRYRLEVDDAGVRLDGGRVDLPRSDVDGAWAVTRSWVTFLVVAPADGVEVAVEPLSMPQCDTDPALARRLARR